MRLFISHGLDKKSTAEMQFLTDIVDGLQAAAPAGAPAIEVLVDRDRLQAGDSWRDVLHEWLAECDAGLLLLSQRALASPWVLKESTVLAYRKAVDADFPLYPVLLEGLKSDALASQGFSPLCLRDLQAIRTPAGAGPAPSALDAATAQAITHTVRARLADWQATVGTLPDTPLAAMQNTLKDRLQRADNLKGLEKLCQDLTGRPLAWRPSKNAKERPAQLVAALLANGLPLPPPDAATGSDAEIRPLSQLIDQLTTHCGLRKSDAAEVLALLQPLWTHAGNAAMLADVAARNRLPMTGTAAPPPGTSVAMQCAMPAFTIDQHVRRVLLPLTPAQVVHMLPAGTSDNRLEELKHAVRSIFRSTLRIPPNMSDSWVDEKLARPDGKLSYSRMVFFVVPDPLPDTALLAELQACFPRQTFILQSGDPLPGTLPPAVVPLVPVSADHEYEMQRDLDVAENLLGHPGAPRTPP
jgi:TIR domain